MVAFTENIPGRHLFDINMNMDTLRNVKDLLRKFKVGELTQPEAQELASLSENGDQCDELRDVLEEFWQNPESGPEDIPTAQMLKRLKRQIRVTEEGAGSSVKNFRINMLKQIVKYAAIVLVTAGLTWLLKDRAERRAFIEIAGKSAETFNEISVPMGSKTRVVLPDGSVVNLNSGSLLRYPSSLDSTRRYAYLEGEAFFDIKKDPRHPFVVKAGNITIKVLGTKFNVKSYGDEKTIETTLVSGTIEIFSTQGKKYGNHRILVLKPNQQAVFERKTGEIAISEIPENLVKKELKSVKPRVQKKIDVNTVIAWKDNRLLFRDESFTEVSRKLERWYNVEIEIQDKELANALLSGIFERETIEQALEALKLATPFAYTMDKNKIIITK
jgi:transmembrane sensor